MRVLTVSEFQEWEKGASVQEFIYASDNQKGGNSDIINASLHFNNSFVCPELRQICFTGNKRDSLFFNRVKEVHMFDDRKSIGVVFDIICDDSELKSFRMLAD